MAIIYITNAIGATNSTTSFSITLPTTQAGDILILEFTHRGTGDGTIGGTSVTTGGLSWSLKHSQLYATSTFSGKTYWARATGNHSGQTVTGSSLTNSCAAILTQYRGALASGDPLADATIVGEQNASGNEGQAAISTATNGAYVVLVVANSPDVAVTSMAAANLTLSPRAERLSTGGTDTSIAHASGELATAGSSGAFSWSQTDGAGGSWAYAITPQALSTFTYTGSGGAVSSGAATTSFSSSRAYTGTGGAVSAGAASTVFESNTSTFEYAGSGGAFASGSAAVAKVKDYLGSGGAVAGGAIPLELTYPATGLIGRHRWITAAIGSTSFEYVGSGGAVTAGAAVSEWQRLFAFEGSGGSVTAAAAETSFSTTYAYAGTGGAVADGTASTEWQRLFACAASGGATTNGAAVTSYQAGGTTAYEYVGSGGATCGGAAATEYVAGAPAVPAPRPEWGRRVRGTTRTLVRDRRRRFSYEGRGGRSGGGSAPCEFAPDYTDDAALALMLAAA